MKVTDPGLRARILEAMGDSESTAILHSMRAAPKDAQSIAAETRVPLSTVYRKLAGLKAAGLAHTSSFRLTAEGKRQDLLVASVTEVRVGMGGDEVEVELIPTPENASRIWYGLFKAQPAEKRPFH